MAGKKVGAVSPLGMQGRLAAERKLGVTEVKIEDAKKAIERDFEKHRGIYPYAGGKVTIQEVLRRAGLNATTLEKPHHADNKAALKKWLEGICKATISGATVIRKAVTERTEDASDEVRKIMQKWSIAELMHADREAELFKARRTITALEEQVAVLEAQVVALQADLAHGKVVNMPKTKART